MSVLDDHSLPPVVLNKHEFSERSTELHHRLHLLQRKLRQQGRPVIIVLHAILGVDLGEVISYLLGELDPRGYRVQAMPSETPEERAYPFLRRYWLRIPMHGELVVFSRAWYRRVVEDRVHRTCKKAEWQSAYDDIVAFETALANNGYLIQKYWLHIDKATQKERLAAMAVDPLERMRLDKHELKAGKHYSKYYNAAEDMMERTHTDVAPWFPISAMDRREMQLTLLNHAIETWERAADGKLWLHAPHPAPRAQLPEHNGLETADLSQSIERPAYEKELRKLKRRARDLQFECLQCGIPVVVVFEGWDAAGKGGAIKRLTGELDPRTCRVVTTQAPSGDDATRHYLWRFWRHVPRAGNWTIFDRSWYGRVLVERVEHLATTHEWQRAYAEINEFELALRNAGVIVVKFWLHISNGEQLARFESRRDDPEKAYKLTADDWRNREKWDEYWHAATEMLQRTDTLHAPWTVVPAESKLFARLEVLRKVIAAIDTDPRIASLSKRRCTVDLDDNGA